MATSVSDISTGRPEGIGREPGNRLPGANPLITDPLVVLLDGQPVDWLGESIDVTHPINGFPHCTLGVRLAKGYAVNTGTEAVPNHQRIEDVVTDANEIIVKTAREDPALDVELFRGNVGKIMRSTTGPDRVSLDLEFIGAILDRELDYFILGQTRPAISDLIAGTQSYDRGEPCVFNPRGRANCYSTRVGGPDDFEMPMFWSAGQPDAQMWSWARVFMHLLGRARIGQAHGIGPVPDINKLTPFDFQDWNLKAVVNQDDLLDRDIGTDPVQNPQMESNPWARYLWGKPQSFVAEGLSWWDAMKAAAMHAGIGMVWEHRRDENGNGKWGIRFILTDIGLAGEFGRSVPVYLPGNAYTTHDKDWGTVRQAANVASVALASDYTNVVNTKSMLGHRTKYEFTVELLPLWMPNDDWDVDTADAQAVADAIAASDGTAFLAKYVTNGADHRDDNTIVGRAWGLNTTGIFDNHYRYSPPFNESRYRLFNLYDVQAGEAVNMATNPDLGTARTILKPRPFETCVTTDANGIPLAPLVEASFDSGATWHRVNVDAKISGYDARIYLRVEDLGAIVNPSTGNVPQQQRNFVYAYISGNLRLRVTAGMYGDFPVFVPRAQINRTLSNQSRGQAVRNLNMQRDLRDDDAGFSGGNSQFKGSSRPAKPRDDTAAATQALYSSIYNSDRINNVGVITLPEIVFFYGNPDDDQNNSGYRPGDLISGIFDVTGQDSGLWNYIVRANQQELGAMIGAISWKYSLGDPEGGGMASQTRITLESVSQNAALRQAFIGNR